MEVLLIIIGLFVMYWRCLGYCYLIDDVVRRWGYLYCVPEESPHPSFYSMKPHKWRHLFLIITHAFNVWLVSVIFGWVPAALFAFSPLSVPMTAWITGGYYAVTTLFTLASYFFLTQYPNFIGVGLSSLFFTAALGSTITCLGFPFLFLFFHHQGLALFIPVLMYLTGHRFTTGYKIRDMGKQDSFVLSKIPLMVKVTAYYIWMVVFPLRLSFFRHFGEDYVRDLDMRRQMHSMDKLFWISASGILAFMIIGWQFSPIGVMWFLVTIAPFTQFKVLGQFVAERYVYLPSIGWYLILGSALASYPFLLAVVLCLYVIRTHLYIPAYEKMENMYEDGIKNDEHCLANYANLGERYIHTGRLREGYEILQEGLRRDPDNFLCYTNIAAYWIQVKDIQKGLHYTEKSIEVGQKKSSWHIVIAMRQQWNNLIEFQRKYNTEVFGEPKKPVTEGASA